MNERKALAGIRVLDFTHYLAGPFCTLQLALQGADVIKIEPVEGDELRASPVSAEWSARRLAPSWMATNVNKRSLTLDIRKPEAVEIVERLVKDIDVVCENFRPGVMERRGIGWSRLSQINPRLVYCAISGFGSTGPQSATPSFDGKIQAMSGLMSLTGDAGSGPMRAGFPAADVTAGMTAAFGVACALVQRSQTGLGQFVDVSMLDSMLSFLAPQVAEYTVAGHHHPQSGNLSITRKPTGNRFRCGEGYIVLAVMTDRQFVNLFKAIGREDALPDPRFANWASRMEHADALHRLIEDALSSGNLREWELKLNDADVPCGAVTSIAEIVGHPQVAHRELIQEAQTPYGPVQLPAGSGFRLAHGSGGVERPLALCGEHTDEILGSIGYDAQQIAGLREAGVV